MCPWPKFMEWAQHFTSFDDPDTEAAYQRHRSVYVLQMCKLCCLLQASLFLALFLVRATKYKLWTHPLPLVYVEELLPFVVIGLLALAIHAKWLRAYAERLLSISALCLVGIVIWEAHEMISLEVLFSQRDTLVNVWGELQSSPTLQAELRAYITREAARKHLTIAAVQLLLLFDLVQFIGMNLWFALTYLAIPVAVALLAALSPQVDPNLPEVYVFVVAVVLHSLCSSAFMRLLRRRQFKADVTLQRTEMLALEAQALQDQMQRERALKRAAEKADVVLSHILKNIMADASGCIYLFLENYPVPDPSQLHRANKCLARGMGWCRRREGILRLTSGSYCPALVATSLKSFVADLAQGHDVVCSVPDKVVLLDPLLCEIVLDNALTNAVHHGDSSCAVGLAVSLSPLGDSPNRNWCRVDVEVTNCARADEPKLTEDLINRLVGGAEREPDAALSEHMGLRHLFMAAEAHRMVVSLQQRGDLVVLRASLETALLDPAAAVPEHNDDQTTPPLPAGVKIFCVDDSEVARRVMLHTFTKHVPGAVVRVFGETPAEVDQFMFEALPHADIVIMDNHLSYGSVELVGAHLLQDLFADGYRGLGCIRSANVSDTDLALYMRCGADCILGKDVPPTAMVQQISAAYADRMAHKP
eukprot:EG_transcript_6207